MLTAGAYTDYVQDHLVQAQYWHDPTEEEEYQKKSKFIAEINQLQVRQISFSFLLPTNYIFDKTY